MKRLALAAAAAALLLPALRSPGRAQPAEPEAEAQAELHEPPMLSERFLDMLKEKLKLKNDQVKKAQAAVDEAREPLKKKTQEVREAMKKARELQKDLRNLEFDLREKIRASLTNDQKERFDEIVIRMREHLRPQKPLLGPKGEEEKREFPPERWEENPDRGRRQAP